MLISKMHQIGILVTTSSVGLLIKHHLVLRQIAISMKLTLRKSSKVNKNDVKIKQILSGKPCDSMSCTAFSIS